MPAKRALIMNPKDNVATTLKEIQSGDTVEIPRGEEVYTVIATEDIPFGFKIAVEDIPKGAMILKYGETIGMASQPIAKGELVHVHNLEGTRARGDLERSKE
ncbi:UxaA family hydrolase [uncultured Desulfosarcina sp.]|uniref:UxaA family hydrolase n=1 Tax=uncultured Desulfosarcina sp. TaxID=218289 RepID=UPI0029C7B48A|nr:UxaA family hydrolase [uncultured Desulfosarcina sp.]